MLQIQSTVGHQQRLRPRRMGPEFDLQLLLEDQIANIFSVKSTNTWLASEISVGAGKPDLVMACFSDILKTSCGNEFNSNELLGYLRTAKSAKPETISVRLNSPLRKVLRKIDYLQERGILYSRGNSYGIHKSWRDVLNNLIAVEVKVADWKKAISQAIRNTVFTHRSFVALPTSAAERAAQDLNLNRFGIGVISIAPNGTARLLRRARSSPPKVWSYYYAVADMVSNDIREGCDALHCRH